MSTLNCHFLNEKKATPQSSKQKLLKYKAGFSSQCHYTHSNHTPQKYTQNNRTNKKKETQKMILTVPVFASSSLFNF